MRRFAQGPAEVVDPNLPWDMTDPAMAEVRFNRLRDTLLTDGFRPGRAIEASTQIARAQALQGKLDDAERTLDSAERKLVPECGREPALRLLLERGRLLVLRRTPMIARMRFLEVIERASGTDLSYYAIDAAQMMAVVETKKKKKSWMDRALQLAEESDDARARIWIGPLYEDLGHHYVELLQYELALTHFDRAAEAFDAQESPHQASVARCAAGRTLRLMDRPVEALELQRRIRVELEQRGEIDGVVFEEIGECLHALKRNEEATRFFSRAFDALSSDDWVTNNEPGRLKRLKQLGKSARPSA